MHYFLFSLTFTLGCKKCLKLTLADPCHICLVQGCHFFSLSDFLFAGFLYCRALPDPLIVLQGCQIENLKEVDRCQNQYMMLLFRYPDQRIRLCNCICISTVDQVTSLWCICIPIVSTNTCQHWPTGLQVLAGEARSGEGARLPLQDHDLRPQPADQQLLTARLVLLENHQSTVWWRKRCLRENDTWDYPLARKLWWVEENGPKIDTEYIYILLIDWPNPLMVDRSIPIFI